MKDALDIKWTRISRAFLQAMLGSSAATGDLTVVENVQLWMMGGEL